MDEDRITVQDVLDAPCSDVSLALDEMDTQFLAFAMATCMSLGDDARAGILHREFQRRGGA